jgi:hypothetical protein
METNKEGLALDAWIDAMPDDVYDLCPCGCGKAFRYVVRDQKELEAHEAKFIDNFKNLSESQISDKAIKIAKEIFSICYNTIPKD